MARDGIQHFDLIYKDSDDNQRSRSQCRCSKKILQSSETPASRTDVSKGGTVMQLKIIMTSPLYPAYRAGGCNDKPQVR